MSRIPNSLNNTDTAVNRNIDNSTYDNIKKVSTAIDEIVVVGTDLQLGDNSAIRYLSNNISTIIPLASQTTAIDNINNNIDNITALVPLIDEISDVASIKSDITSIAPYTDNINLVSSNVQSINILSTNIDNTNRIIPHLDSIEIDANNIGSINVIANDLVLAGWSNITDAGSITDAIEVEAQATSMIREVGENINDVIITGSNIDAITTTANNINDINIIVNNITDIQNAEENANIALANANITTINAGNVATNTALAHKWASELEDVPITGTVGIDEEYSAYHWAKKAEAALGGNITLDSLYDVNVSNPTNGSILRYDSVSGWIDYDFTYNHKLGFNTAGSLIETGELAWNPDEMTLSVGLNNGLFLPIGQGDIRVVRNTTGSTITAGTLCMYDGTVGNSGRIKIKPFTAAKGTESHIYGMTIIDIPNATDGYVIIAGKVKPINTTGSTVSEVWTDGTILWAKPNGNGKLTNVEPNQNELKLEVASIIKSHLNGTLEVRIIPLDRNFSYSRMDSDTRYVPLNNDFNLDLGGL